jgi:hypothetical protein
MSQTTSIGQHTVPLPGIDGSNPLGFLAALGTLRVLSREWPDRNIQLRWRIQLAAWRPELTANQPLSEDEIVDTLDRTAGDVQRMFPDELLNTSLGDDCPTNNKGESKWRDKLRFPAGAFAKVLRGWVEASGATQREPLDYAAAWATDAYRDEVDKREVARRTRFDFTAGQQTFIGMIRDLRSSCSQAEIHRCLFRIWEYPTDTVSLRWDPEDEKRQYALQAFDPTDSSKNPTRSEPGANLLAAEGLALLPVIPAAGGASQPGLGHDRNSRYWVWPIWQIWLDLDTLRSVLALPLEAMASGHPAELAARGIALVYRSRIVQPSGRYRCFTPADVLY